MDLSPSDIRNYEFNTQMRGFDKEDVASLLEQVAVTLEDLKQDLLKKTVEMDSLQKQYDGLKGHEDTIKSAAIDARRNADQTIKDAKKEADELLADAQLKGENLIHDKTHECRKIEVQISNLNDTKKSYHAELKSLVESHLVMVDEVAEAEFEIPEVATTDFEVTDSTDVTADKMETIANKMSEDNSDTETPEENIEEKAYSEPETTEKANDNVDPELENALKNYQQDIDNGPENNADPNQPMFGPERVVETTAKAEDIPEGFFVENKDGMDNSTDTDKVETASNKSSKKDLNETGPLKPEELAEELDNVAAKFDEVLDEAVKTK